MHFIRLNLRQIFSQVVKSSMFEIYIFSQNTPFTSPNTSILIYATKMVNNKTQPLPIQKNVSKRNFKDNNILTKIFSLKGRGRQF